MLTFAYIHRTTKIFILFTFIAKDPLQLQLQNYRKLFTAL